MLKLITTGAAVAACILLPMLSDEALAQSAPLYIHAIDIDVVPGQIDNYLAALEENGTASVKEPGCREFDIMVSQKDPKPRVRIGGVDNAAAQEAHRQTDHFKKYAATTKAIRTTMTRNRSAGPTGKSMHDGCAN